MMIVPFESDHVQMMDVQAAQRGEIDFSRLDRKEAWTAVVDGRPICCAGLQEMWPGRAYAWALLAHDAGRYMVRLTRAIRSRLDCARFQRVEMAVAAHFAPGVRWARMLGFEMECKARKYMPDGGDAWIFVRV